jgi:hypothetical protein
MKTSDSRSHVSNAEHRPSITRALALASSFALASLGFAACEPNTGGKVVELELTLQARGAGDAAPGRFVTSTGWSVELSEALAAVGPVYVYENPPAQARTTVTDDRAWALRWLIPAAHAHPGASHYDGGEAKGEWIGQSLVDVLSNEPSVRVRIPGTAGEVASLAVHLEPPRTGLVGRERLGDDHLRVVGVAEKEGVVVPFAGGLRLEADAQQRVIQGVPLSGSLDEGVTLRLYLHPAAWLDEARFETLLESEPDEDGRYPITEGSQVQRAWFIGARSLSGSAVVDPSFSAVIEGGAR